MSALSHLKMSAFCMRQTGIANGADQDERAGVEVTLARTCAALLPTAMYSRQRWNQCPAGIFRVVS